MKSKLRFTAILPAGIVFSGAVYSSCLSAPASNSTPATLDETRLGELSLRLEEIVAKDLNRITKVEKKALRREVKSLKGGLRSRLLLVTNSLDRFQIDEWLSGNSRR